MLRLPLSLPLRILWFIVSSFFFFATASFLFAGDEGAIVCPIRSAYDVFHIFNCTCRLLISLKRFWLFIVENTVILQHYRLSHDVVTWRGSRRYNCILLVFFRQWGRLVTRRFTKHDVLLWLAWRGHDPHYVKTSLGKWYALILIRYSSLKMNISLGRTKKHRFCIKWGSLLAHNKANTLPSSRLILQY